MPETVTNIGPDASTAPIDSSDLTLGPLIGEGAQYKVYDMGDRVRKVPQTIEDSEAAIRWWYPGTESEVTAYARKLHGLGFQSSHHVRTLIAHFPESAEFFGNPTFYDDGTIDQDKMPSVGETIEAQPEMTEEYLWQYVQSIPETWKYGCHDQTFNLLSNYGVSSGKVVMRDFGEMGFDKDDMHKLITERAWEEPWEYQNVLTEAQQGFMRGATRAMLTHEELDQRWATAIENPPPSSYTGHIA